MALTPSSSSLAEIEYPDSDGEPVAESDFRLEPWLYVVSALRTHFLDRADVYVGGNLLIYYEEGNPRSSVAPDVFVVFGAPKHKRRIYQVWVEGKGPDVVLEITSHTTRRRDEEQKPEVYRRMGIKEYFQYDPTGDYLRPALKGRILDAEGAYQPMAVQPLGDGGLCLASAQLGLELQLHDGRLWLFDSAHQKYLPTYEEINSAHQAADQARREAEQRVALLEAELARLRTQLPRMSDGNPGGEQIPCILHVFVAFQEQTNPRIFLSVVVCFRLSGVRERRAQ